jgi:hypothetical protein
MVGDGGGEILWAALLLAYYVVLMMLFQGGCFDVVLCIVHNISKG